MAKRLIDLRNVPSEEADGVRALLDELGIEWYELPPTAFGLSAGSIWIRDNEDFARAREAFDRFQAEYTERARREPDNAPGRLDPLHLIGALVAAAAILGFFFWPIVQLSSS